MIQSLEKKYRVLQQIAQVNQRQKALLEDPNLEPDTFDANVEEKAKLAEQLNLLDDGFEKLFGRVREELNADRARYAAQIRRMQELIQKITAMGADVETLEARNRVLMQTKFREVHKQARSVRNSQKVVKQYYNNMVKANAYEPQFLDNKK